MCVKHAWQEGRYSKKETMTKQTNKQIKYETIFNIKSQHFKSDFRVKLMLEYLGNFFFLEQRQCHKMQNLSKIP